MLYLNLTKSSAPRSIGFTNLFLVILRQSDSYVLINFFYSLLISGRQYIKQANKLCLSLALSMNEAGCLFG